MLQVMIAKADCRDESDGYHIDSFMSILNSLGYFPTEVEYENIESIEIEGTILFVSYDDGTNRHLNLSDKELSLLQSSKKVKEDIEMFLSGEWEGNTEGWELMVSNLQKAIDKYK